MRDTGDVRTEAARAALAAWRESFPADPYAADGQLRAILARALPEERRVALDARAGAFARQVVAVVGPAARRYEQGDRLPELARYDGIGRRTENIVFDPDYRTAGKAVWASGLVSLSAEPGSAYEQATLLYLLSLEGEAGHACPATCTIGLARALRRQASHEVRNRYLPVLVEEDWDNASRGSQFLTEVQGGSDVGANECCAAEGGDGAPYRIRGEKWFCSVADAGQFLVVARVQGSDSGTRGLGCFVVPRLIDGRPNGFALRRLKDKLGTRGMASGEIDFDDAQAWPLGPVENGFRTAVGVVLNTSRWMTALGSVGMMRRACLEAASYARHRVAFGRPVVEFGAVRRTLADMGASWMGALHVVFALTQLEDRVDADTAGPEDVLMHRFAVNVVKYVVSSRATEVVRAGIEVLGGNGTIEDFSVLPRLYRDCIVYESWEGTHNVLVAEVLRDMRRLSMVEVVAERATKLLAGVPSETSDRVRDHLERALADARRALDDEAFADVHFRGVLDRLGTVLECVHLLDAGHEAVAGYLTRRDLDVGYRASDDPRFAEHLDAVLAAVGP